MPARPSQQDDENDQVGGRAFRQVGLRLASHLAARSKIGSAGASPSRCVISQFDPSRRFSRKPPMTARPSQQDDENIEATSFKNRSS